MKTTIKDRVMLAAPATIMGTSLRAFFSNLTDVEYMGSTDQVDEVSSLLSEYRPDTLILDAHLIHSSSEALDAYLDGLHRRHAHTKIVVILTYISQPVAPSRWANVQFVSQDELGQRLRGVLFARKFIRPASHARALADAYAG